MRNLSGQHRIEKDRLLNINEFFDPKAEIVPLNVDKRKSLRLASDELAKLWHEEESEWDQRSKV
jgi:hypothetical protein